MIRRLVLALTALSAVSVHAADKPPVVVELYQAQGCSSCPPADLNLNALADRPDVLALSFAVTYWDQLGWKDTFAKPAYTQRQWDYAHAARRNVVATPSVVINGQGDLIGNNRAQLDAAIAKAAPLPGPAITVSNGKAQIGAGAAANADVWLVRYDPRTLQVPIARGENGGKTLAHRNIVRDLTRLGAWNGQPTTFAIPESKDTAVRTAILVQVHGGGPILSAAKL